MSLPPHVTQATSGRKIAVQTNPFDDWETVSLLAKTSRRALITLRFLQAYERNDRIPLTEEARNAKLWSDA
jgi:hypothetical protein